ncbi:P27 [Xanthomonas phage phiL7]|uniref:p27 n=1 Tax=Xanthomonas phage phiL7 TaxID=538979 RepID=C4ML27_9CAUD|nr:holin [Xanthomonas phage phiL7]ACE75767.1 P27 [Xanthomonas phage phiL7]
MSTKVSDVTVVGGLGLGSVYMNFVSTYGGAVITTLAILVAVVTLVLRVQEFMQNLKESNERRAPNGRKKRRQ